MNKEKSKNNYTKYLLCFIFSALIILGALHFFTNFKINNIMSGGSYINESRNKIADAIISNNNSNIIPDNIKILIKNSLDKF